MLLVIILSAFTVFNSVLITHASTVENSLTVSLSKILNLDNVPGEDNSVIAHGRFENDADLNYWSINAEYYKIRDLPEGLRIIPNESRGLYIESSSGFVLWQTLDPNAVEAVKGYKMLFGILVAPLTTAKVTAYIGYATSSGGGCPLLYVWNGSNWIFDNNLLPKGHLGYSKDRYLLNVYPAGDSIKLKIAESGDSITFLDLVKLYSIIHPENTIPVIEVISGDIILLNLNQSKELLTPYYVKDIFGNNITLVMEKPDNDSYELAPKTWLIAYFRGVRHLEKPILLIRSDPVEQLAYKTSLIIQVYENGAWRNVAILSPRYQFYVDAIDVSKYVPKHSDELIIRIIATAYHRIDWIALAPSSTYKVKGYELVELDLKDAVLVSNNTKVNVVNKITKADKDFVKIEKGQELYLVFEGYNKVKPGRKISYLLEVQGYYKIIGGSTIIVKGQKFIVKPHSLAWQLVYATAYIPEDAVSVTVYVSTSDNFEGYIDYAHALIEPVTPENTALVYAEANTGYYVHSATVAGIYAAYSKYDGFKEVVFAPSYVRYSYYEYTDPSGKTTRGKFDAIAKQYIGVSITGAKEQVTINRATVYYANDKNVTDQSASIIEWNREIEAVSTIGSIASIVLSVIGLKVGEVPMTLASIATSIFSTGLMELKASEPRQLNGITAYKEVNYRTPWPWDTTAVSLSIMGYKAECSIYPADLPVNITIQFNTENDIYPNPPEIIKVIYTITS